MGKQNYSHTLKKREKTAKIVDPCIVCKKELYYDEGSTQRIGLLEDDGEVSGWACTHCETQFDMDSNITNFYGAMKVEAKA